MFSSGEDIGALVLDLGSGFSKVGFAGEHVPRAVYPSIASLNDSDMHIDEGKSKRGLKFSCGQSLFYAHHSQKLVQPVQHGLWTDLDAVESLIEHGVNNRLSTEVSSHPLLLCESVNDTNEKRERFCELLFETFEAPAVFFARDAMLSALAMGRTTALVVDCGAGSTRVVPVHDGYALTQSMLQTRLGGDALDGLLTDIFEKGVGEFSKSIEIVPRFRVKRNIGSELQRTFEVIEVSNVDESYEWFMRKEVMRDLKESICSVSDTVFVPENNVNMPTFPYELPDGNLLSVGPPRFLVPEMLFAPDKRYMSLEDDFNNYQFPGLCTMIDEAIGKCDIDLRRDLFSNICIVGGGSKCSGLSDRLQRELEDAASAAFKVKLVAGTNSFETEFAPWIGGSILASIGSFQQMWLSKSEYEEEGTRFLASRCP